MQSFLLGLALLFLGIDQAVSSKLFDDGKEYQYSYVGLFTTGTEKPVSHASSYLLIGALRVQGSKGDSFTAKLEGMKIGMYNGRWSYFPIPSMGFFDDKRLSTLEDPFKVTLTQDGKFKTLTMNDQEPEFASNLKRGLATYLQLNTSSGFNSVQIYKQPEMTTLGECPTAYEIIPPKGSSKYAVVGKYRNHADCPDIPTRTRTGPKAYYKCTTDKTRDIFNSTSYATYEVSLDGNNPSINKVTIFSSILYWPFTSANQYLYTWFNVTLALVNVGPITSPIPSPENPENHEDLAYVFEQSDYQDPEEETSDLRTVEPFFFHQPTVDVDAEANSTLITKAKQAVENAATSLNTSITQLGDSFHRNSPTSVSRALAFLDQDALKFLYRHYSAQGKEDKNKLVNFQIFLDGLIMAGTSSSGTVIRDIILEEAENWATLSRILTLFPNYIRTPSELLAKEFDTVFNLLKDDKLGKTRKRLLEFSLATLVSRSCERNLCSSTGLLDKYISYFGKKFTDASSFDEQVAAILGLRNLRIGKSLDKVLDIATGKISASNVVRVQAIWSLRPLFFTDKEGTTKTILRVFYNRTESCETRTSVFGLLMSTQPDEKVLLEIAYFMWSETCLQTLNYVRTTLTHMSKAVGPCSKLSTHARTILHYLPPGEVDNTKTSSYAMEYYDESYGFGRSYYMSVQKSGKTALPVSIYMGASHSIAGFASNPVGLFIRIEGLGKFIPSNIMSDIDAQTAEKILKVLSDLKVPPKTATPLKLELTLMYLDRVIYHYAADEESLRLSVGKAAKEVDSLIKSWSEKGFEAMWERSALVSETLYQQPLEVGIPVSIYTAASVMNFVNGKVGLAYEKFKLNLDLDVTLKAYFSLKTAISNHVPVLGTMHTAGLLRTLRVQRPQEFSMKFNDGFPTGLSFKPPSVDNPLAIQSHGSAFVSVSNESPTVFDAGTLLKSSCPNCETFASVSSGPGISETKDIASTQLWNSGMRVGVKKVKCERHISKSRVLQKVQKFFSTEGKNTGVLDSAYSKFVLGFQSTIDYFVLWPNAEPCGFQFYLSKNWPNETRVLKEVEVSISMDAGRNEKLEQVRPIIYRENYTLTFEGPSAPAPEKRNIMLSFSPEENGQQKMKLHFNAEGLAEGKSLVGCFDVHSTTLIPKTDILGFEGDNEPKVTQILTIKLGKVANVDESQCPSDMMDIKIKASAQRSEEQKREAQSSQDYAYLLCQMEKASGNWPKNMVPPTPECFQVTLDQTGLRQANFTVNYKVSPELRKRWSRPSLFIANLLSPFLTETSKESDHAHSNNQNEGSVELDLNIRKQNPVMDIHYIKAGSTEEFYYHNIDLELLPSFLRFKPAPSRFSPFVQFLYKAGFRGSCSVTPKNVVTFDNLKYATKLSNCETLIAGDCGEWPDFAVFAKTSENNKLVVRLQARGTELKIEEGEISSSKGKLVFDSNGKYSDAHVHVIKKGKEILVRWRPFFGITLRYSGGDFIQISASSKYRGLTCGLCGNFDTSGYNDLTGPTSSSCPLTSISDAWRINSDAGECMKVDPVC